MAGLYFHIPFCKRVCAYCDFYKEVGTERLPALVEAMYRELDARHDYLGGEPVRTRYFGGGTPSLCSPETIRGLLDRAAQIFDCSAVEETTLEANPDDLDAPYLAALREAGIDRLSIGVQSFDDDCLRLMNRRHNAAQAAEAIRTARNVGFDNITADVIFGVPGFGGDSLRRTLDRLIESDVQHISAYHLTVEPDTAFGRRAARGTFVPVDDATSEEEFRLVHETLCSAGFEHYEISNFARHGVPCPPQRRLLARGPLSGHRPCRPLLRRRQRATLERRFGGPLHRGRTAGERTADRDRPFQRIPADPSADGRGYRPYGRGATVRTRTHRTVAPLGATLVAGRYVAYRRRTHSRACRMFLVSDTVIGALFETDDEK